MSYDLKMISKVNLVNKYMSSSISIKRFYGKRSRPMSKVMRKRFYKRYFDNRLYRMPTLNTMNELSKDFYYIKRKPLYEEVTDFVKSIPSKAMSDDVSRLLLR